MQTIAFFAHQLLDALHAQQLHVLPVLFLKLHKLVEVHVSPRRLIVLLWAQLIRLNAKPVTLDSI